MRIKTRYFSLVSKGRHSRGGLIFFIVSAGLLSGIFTGSFWLVSAQAAPEDGSVQSEELCWAKNDVQEFESLRTGQVPTFQSADPCESAKLAFEVKNTEQDQLEERIRTMSAGYPLERMSKDIAGYDTEIAGLIVGIAKKESDWGKHVPLAKDGSDCFNYWGYKGAGTRGIAMGHGCFGSPEEAVQAVGNRLVELTAKRQSTEPARMVVWKCGSSCATHSPQSVQSWIGAVNKYYRQITAE